MDLYTATIKLYEEFFRQVTLRSYFSYFPKLNDKILICKFIRWVNVNRASKANVAFLIGYFEFQFSHYSGVETRYGKNCIMMNWLIGAKAIKRFEERNVSKRWLVRLKLKEEVGLNLNKLFKENVKTKKTIVRLYPQEEQDKQRFYNKPEGFLFCLTTTTLYNPLSELCLNCVNKIDCMKVLEVDYNKTFLARQCQK